MSWSRWNSLPFAALVAVACGGPQEPGGSGDDCFRIADCAEGFICIDNQCSRDLSRAGSDYNPAPPMQQPPTDAATSDGPPSTPDGEPPPPPEASSGTGGAPPTDSGRADAPGSGGQPPSDAAPPEAGSGI